MNINEICDVGSQRVNFPNSSKERCNVTFKITFFWWVCCSTTKHTSAKANASAKRNANIFKIVRLFSRVAPVFRAGIHVGPQSGGLGTEKNASYFALFFALARRQSGEFLVCVSSLVACSALKARRLMFHR